MVGGVDDLNENAVDRRWVTRSILYTGVALAVVIVAQAVVVSAYIHGKIASTATNREYDLETLPTTYDAVNHPIRRIVFESAETDYSLNVIATKLFNTSYMELYSEDSVVIHVDTHHGIYLSLPSVGLDNEIDSEDQSPYVQALIELQQSPDTYDATATHSLIDSAENRRKLRLRIGRFYICIFCKGSWRCSGNVRRRRWRVGCRRLIAIGFDAER